MKQTAVEWLIERLMNGQVDNKMLETAKEMEKQQKLECFIEGYKKRAESSNLIFDNASRMYATALFNETFKQQKQ